jgi:hypothetical protein
MIDLIDSAPLVIEYAEWQLVCTNNCPVQEPISIAISLASSSKANALTLLSDIKLVALFECTICKMQGSLSMSPNADQGIVLGPRASNFHHLMKAATTCGRPS